MTSHGIERLNLYMNTLGPFGCILAFCASLVGGGPQSDGEVPVAPQPESVQERYVGEWQPGADSQCALYLRIEETSGGLSFSLKNGNTEQRGLAEPTENWIYLGKIASANFDASAGVLVFRNDDGRGKPALPECEEDIIVLVPDSD